MKTCFVVSAIGSPESQTRKNSDAKLEHLYKEVLQKMDYLVERADTIDEAGSISQDIVRNIVESDLVIADISENNSNVFYELAVRNAVSKPYLLIKEPHQNIPFDIKDIRALDVDLTNIGSFLTAKDILKKHVESAERDPEKASFSILSSFDFVNSKHKKKNKKTSVELSKIAKKAVDTRQKNKKEKEYLKFKNENTIVCPSRGNGLQFFLKTNSWNAVKIWHERIPFIKYIALYETAPLSSIRYYGKIQKIQQYKETNKFEILLKKNPIKLKNPIILSDSTKVPQASRYTSIKLLRNSNTIDEIFEEL